MTVSVKELSQHCCAQWDEFVTAHPEGTFCHLAGWKEVIETGAGHECLYLLAEKDSEIVGVLPLTIRRSLLFGKLVVSNMFAVYGGPLATSDEAYEALDNAAWQRTLAAGAQVLEYRSVHARHQGGNDWFVQRDRSATFKKELSIGDEETILHSIPRKQRAVVRKAQKNGLSSDWNGSIDEFYDLYARSVHGLGSPVFPKHLFVALKNKFPNDVLIQIVRNCNGRGVASLMSFVWRGSVMPYYAGSGPESRGLAAHDFMYFELMKKAGELGCNEFDFGRSKIGTGPYRFKKHWGFEPQSLEYEFRLASGAEIPDISPQNLKYRMMIALWKRLPLFVANAMGPMLARHLG